MELKEGRRHLWSVDEIWVMDIGYWRMKEREVGEGQEGGGGCVEV